VEKARKALGTLSRLGHVVVVDPDPHRGVAAVQGEHGSGGRVTAPPSLSESFPARRWPASASYLIWEGGI
jgi:hypothetical protein